MSISQNQLNNFSSNKIRFCEVNFRSIFCDIGKIFTLDNGDKIDFSVKIALEQYPISKQIKFRYYHSPK